MKKILPLLACLFLSLTVQAVPARRYMTTVQFRDGTMQTIILRGDETFHYYTTLDGQAVRESEDGLWEPDSRDIQAIHSAAIARRNIHRQRLAEKTQKLFASRRIGEVVEDEDVSDIKRGLLILVNFSDLTMKNGDDSQALFDQMLNSIGKPYGKNYGSVREYFRAQSYGLFDIKFDVVGPVTVSKTMAYYGKDVGGEGNDNAPEKMIVEACELVDSLVNFSDYDWDGDGEVENIYVIYAGYGQASGASTNTIWPHQWQLSEANGKALKLDGVIINTYACGSELYGNSGSTLDGIGTMCHEYSHCLGLPDFYDTNYKNFGMGTWSVMDAGCYNGDGFHPAGYTAYERMFSGWLTPTELNEGTTIEGMNNIEEHPEAYIIYNDANHNEYYLLENHQKVGWDQKAYGHGMLVLHVDFDRNAWYNNTVNDLANRQRMTIIPADNSLATSASMLAGDPFPGTKRKKQLTDESTPKATLYRANTDGKKLMHKPITDIAESNGLISFKFMGGTKLPVLVEAPVLDSLMVENVDYTSTTLTARWNEVENAVSYNLHISSQAVKEDSEEPSSQTSITVESTITGITDTSYTVEDLPNGATVTYKVQAVDENGGESEWSKAVTIVLPRESDAIPSLYSNPSQQKQLFDLSGRHVNTRKAQRGIYILNGQKVVLK